MISFKKIMSNLLVLEQEDMESILNKRFENPDTGNLIKVSSALGYKEKSPKVYNIAKAHLSRRGFDDSEIEKAANGSEEEPSTTPTPPKETGEERIVAGKNKTLRPVDSLGTKEFNRELEPSADEFDAKNEKIKNPIPPQPYKLPESLRSNPKFPKKYLDVIERMMNTQPKGDGTKWSHYSDIPGGAGQISAQAGELMVMMGTSMSDDEFNEFTKSLLNHEQELIKSNPAFKSEGSRVITKSWIQSAKNNRKAIISRIKKQYPGAEIEATAWDTENDVVSLGLSDYKKNKGFSTDMYIKIKTKDGESILDEVSLKKSTKVNFLNSGAGKFMDWDKDLPDEINQNNYRDRQREGLSTTGKKLQSEVQKLLDSNSPEAKKLKELFKSKNIDFDRALEDTINNNGSRAKSKVILQAIKSLADSGNAEAKSYIDNVIKEHETFRKNAIEAITKNEKLKEGMLSEIRNEFPLKAISDGEETMAIGDISLDKNTMQEIFGTSDYDQIKENLVARPGPPPFLGYRVSVGNEVIPIASIEIREDGVGYGGVIKFEMKLHSKFANTLKTAQASVYKS